MESSYLPAYRFPWVSPLLYIFLAILPAMLVCPQVMAQTNISGVINRYAKVTYISVTKDRLRVTNNVFAKGDRVLVIQMKGASVDTANTRDYGNITSLNHAGKYEFANIISVRNDTVSLLDPLCRDYRPEDSVQLVSVPVYSGDVTIAGKLTCLAWGPGGIGGVLAFEVSDSLLLDADIDVSGMGFRGGQVKGHGFACNSTVYYSATSWEGIKGEGITHHIDNQFYGRGRLASGGGGSGGGNSGAGGGGNYGRGGNGGNQFSDCDSATPNGSIGGSALFHTADRIYMGGGGGGPQMDNGQPVFPGGNGGGIIIIKAKSIRENNHLISSDGADVTMITGDEGASGGGGGGSIYLMCNNYTDPLQVTVTGGDGESSKNDLFFHYCHGPGGGGAVWLSAPALPGNVTVNLAGGASGMVLNPMSPCYNTSFKAQPGDSGGIFYNLPYDMLPRLGLHDSIICTDTTTITLTIGSGYRAIRWSTGDTTPAITATATGIYSVEATPISSNCVSRDTARITRDAMSLGADTVICPGKPFILVPRLSNSILSYVWQDGTTGASVTAEQAGRYYVTVRTRSDCTLSDTILVAIDSVPALHDTLLCNTGATTLLSLPPGHKSYLWSTGETTATIIADTTRIYTVETVTSFGCIFRDTANVVLETVSLGNDTLICGDTSHILAARPGGYLTYLWQDGSTGSATTAKQSGKYYVTALTQKGCSLSDTIELIIDNIPALSDTVLCGPYAQVVLSRPPGHRAYLWSTGETTSAITVRTAGTYMVETITTFGCTFLDTAKVIMETISLGNDTQICAGTTYTLVPQPADHYAGYRWQDGSTGTEYMVVAGGTYTVTITTANGCVLSDTVSVTVLALPELQFEASDSLLCEGQPLLLHAEYTSEGLLSLEWDLGNGIIRSDTDIVRYFYDTPGSFLVKLTGHYRACPDKSDSQEITIYPYPVLNIGPDTAICPGGPPISIADLENGNNDEASWQWSNGEKGSSILVTAPGRYYAMVTIHGCSTIDSMNVHRSCYIEIPNAFIPDGDGINNYFFPRGLLSRAVTSFRMRVYNRWGLLLFETAQTDGRGWDGQFNNKPQPQGVYVYMIEVSFADGASERYQGNVTLLR